MDLWKGNDMDSIDKVLEYVRRTNKYMTREILVEKLKASNSYGIIALSLSSKNIRGQDV